jgi:hypothetical protein
MSDALQIQLLRDWRYAGKPAEGAIAHGKRMEGGRQIVLLPSSYPNGDSYELREYFVENGYLIPHYEVGESTRKRRDTELFKDRIQRFFYSCEPNLDVSCSQEFIDAEIANFDKNLARINEERAHTGQPPFSLSLPYRQASRDERQLVSDGAQIVGHAVNRLGRLGMALLQGNREGIKLEYSDDYIKNHRDKIEAQFVSLWSKLTDESHASLVRCVLTRDGKPDYDAVFHHLIREMVKPVVSVLSQDQLPRSKAAQSQDTPIMQETRTNIVTQIGYCLGAIDETAHHMKKITMSPGFNKLLKRAERARRDRLSPLKPEVNDLDLHNYAGQLREYTDVCRARACIKSDDNDNFTPVVSRLRFLHKELTMHHELLFRFAETLRAPDALECVQLLKRGINLMGEMAELRLPRNHKANGIYDKDHERFAGRDASSVGRLAEKIDRVTTHMVERPSFMLA